MTTQRRRYLDTLKSFSKRSFISKNANTRDFEPTEHIFDLTPLIWPCSTLLTTSEVSHHTLKVKSTNLLKIMRPPTNAFREALKVTASGACTVLLSTTLSCGLAIAIETSAHRLQYKLFPHWYDGKVKYAMGLPHLQHQKLDSEIAEEEKKLAHVATPVVIVNSKGAGVEQNVPLWKEEVMLASDKSQSKFQTYSEKIQEKAQEKAQLISSERVSKMILTTAMTG